MQSVKNGSENIIMHAIKMCLYFRLVFLLGMVSDVGLQKPLLDEAMKYNDIVQGRFKSIYHASVSVFTCPLLIGWIFLYLI